MGVATALDHSRGPVFIDPDGGTPREVRHSTVGGAGSAGMGSDNKAVIRPQDIPKILVTLHLLFVAPIHVCFHS